MDYQKAIDNFQPVELIDRDVKVDLEYIGEGTSGDYNPDDPQDKPLLRFTLYKKELGDVEWEEVENGSYCTRISITTVRNDLVEIAENILAKVIGDIREGEGIKRKCEELSWTDGLQI